jgi:hypothetical protein
VRTSVHYIPIATTFIALAFCGALVARYRQKGGTHLLWWAIGTFTYAAGTAAEASVTLFGWSEGVFRFWYIAGALLGGAPLAQGAVYLHLPKRLADRLSVALVIGVAVASLFVLAVPIRQELVEAHRLTGRVMAWPWVRAFSPFINLYAFVFLVGGAVRSAVQSARRRETRYRATANALIAVGALLPGIGGSFTRFGHTEVLYVTEFVGIILIYLGYRHAVRGSPAPPLPSHELPDSRARLTPVA